MAERDRGGTGGVWWLVGCVGLALAAALLLRTFVFGTYLVPSGSMLETIQEGDLLVGERVTLHFEGPQPGDVVTFDSPLDDQTLIKRVIAVAGQSVDLRDGFVYVDGVALDEPYTLGKLSYSLSDLAGAAQITYPYTVPAGCVWVMGDNRTNSKDSRYFGAVSVDDVTSRALFIYWPLADVAGL
jgi:signal peptidase I